MATKKITSLSKIEFKSFMESIDVILSDCDGVLWRETEVIQGSPDTVNKFKQLGKRFFYITNNNTKTRSEFVEKCKGLKYDATMEEIVCTSFLAAVYLKEKNFDKKVYVVGSVGITKELEAMGIKHCGIGPDVMDGDEVEMVKNFKPDSEVGAVIVGFDKYFSFPKLVKAATYLQDPNVHFIGTNCDTERPSPNTNRFPGTGCFVKTIESASNRTAVMLGKPESFVSEHIITKYNLNPERTLMIGDNRDTDILLGKRCGFKTLLVLTGITTQSDVDAINASTVNFKDLIVPDYYIDHLGDILTMIDLS
ncbi:PREDICTED: phosphoglycolate phosphatase-like [Dufourea novaeangliae]|uniref:Phosphoglycolate phosphatase n=1 Tax=Dufourea novaeangliae TaxID=178035 RepID=A0A154PHN7_DUFNO|nr:PREDICTED: phosphoglycolate phosphatase-like [Dufourea novaeangliae]KZC11359.1 Phosphoglycolate phosphatase [Dufourea novaeangliae]